MTSEKTLILIRGVSGSGKSTLAQMIVDSINFRNIGQGAGPARNDVAHLEADMYWVGEDGEYRFAAARLGAAHAWCQELASAYMGCHIQTVIVSNTFVKRWEMQPYLDMARRYGYKVQEIICQGRFENIHDLSEEFVQSKRDQFEY